MFSRSARLLPACAAAVVLLLAAPAAGAVTIEEFPVEAGAPAGAHLPTYIAPSPQGSLWFTDLGSSAAVRAVNTAGAPLTAITQFPPTADLGFGPDGTLFWARTSGFGLRKPNGTVEFDENNDVGEGYAIGFARTGEMRYTGYDGNFAKNRYSLCSAAGCNGVAETRLTDIVLGADGALWMLEPEADQARRRADEGIGVTSLAVPLPVGSHPGRAALGPDGNLWLAGFGNGFGPDNTLNQIVRLTPAGQQTSFLLPPGRGPNDIALGPDGALWFTEYLSGSIGRITTAGEYSSCPLPDPASSPGPYGIATGADGAIWFTEREAGAIGRLTGGNCVPAPSAPATTTAAGGADVTRPSVARLKLAPAAFKPAGSGPSVVSGRRAGAGAKVTFDLSEPGRVAFRAEKKGLGSKVGGVCRPRSAATRGKPGCIRFTPVAGAFSVDAREGINSFDFSGRLGGRALAPAGYRLLATARDGAGNESLPANAVFSVRRR